MAVSPIKNSVLSSCLQIQNGPNVQSAEHLALSEALQLLPLTLVDIPGGAEQRRLEDGSQSLFNPAEANIAIYYAEHVAKLHHKQLKAQQDAIKAGLADGAQPAASLIKPCMSVGIITPYRAQVDRIKGRLEGLVAKYSSTASFLVASVDSFQGEECDVIIISTVRANADGNVGFVKDRRRLNVMLTRARHALIVICNMATLRKDQVRRVSSHPTCRGLPSSMPWP